MLKALAADGYVTEQQDADTYLVHGSGFHLFAIRGRIVRALANWRVVEVQEITIK